MTRRNKTEDCRACFARDCDCDCRTCTAAREQRERLHESPHETLVQALVAAMSATREKDTP